MGARPNLTVETIAASAFVASAVEVKTPDAIAPTLASIRPDTSAAGSLASTSVAVLTVVPDKLSDVVGLPTFAQSTPASPPADTSNVRPAVVGLNDERFSIENIARNALTV